MLGSKRRLMAFNSFSYGLMVSWSQASGELGQHLGEGFEIAKGLPAERERNAGADQDMTIIVPKKIVGEAVCETIT
jgi:hypothetical protein